MTIIRVDGQGVHVGMRDTSYYNLAASAEIHTGIYATTGR